MVEEIRDGRVYFRNPWGPRDDEAGTTYEDPDRRLEDPDSGLESMTIEEFERQARNVFSPTESSPVL